jgi:hypothetical protein
VCVFAYILLSRFICDNKKANVKTFISSKIFITRESESKRDDVVGEEEEEEEETCSCMIYDESTR